MNEEVKQSIQGAYLKNDKPYTIDDITSDQHGFFEIPHGIFNVSDSNIIEIVHQGVGNTLVVLKNKI